MLEEKIKNPHAPKDSRKPYRDALKIGDRVAVFDFRFPEEPKWNYGWRFGTIKKIEPTKIPNDVTILLDNGIYWFESSYLVFPEKTMEKKIEKEKQKEKEKE